MRQSSMQNLPNDLAPTKQILREALEEVEVSDRVPQPESHSTKTPSVKFSQAAIDTSTNTELSLAQTSRDLTILQTANPTEVNNDNITTHTLSNQSSQNSSMSVVSVDRVSSSSQKPVVVEQIDSSSQPTQILEVTNLTQDTIVQSFSKDDSENFDVAEATVVQNHSNTIIQHSDSVIQNITDRTAVQYSDSGIHNPAQQRIYRSMSPLSTSLDRTILQSGRQEFLQSSTPTILLKNRSHIQLFHPSIFRNMFGTSGSFISRFTSITRQFFYSIWRKIDLRQPQFRLNRQLAGGKTLKQLSSNPLNRSTHNTIALDEQPSSEQYQKKLRELDLCRLDFAKELAKNGNFRKAIAVAQQISEMSYFFKDAQMLIQSWKQF